MSELHKYPFSEINLLSKDSASDLRGLEHCLKSFLIQSFFVPYFPAFRLNTQKIRIRKTPYMDTFHAVESFLILVAKTLGPPIIHKTIVLITFFISFCTSILVFV